MRMILIGLLYFVVSVTSATSNEPSWPDIQAMLFEKQHLIAAGDTITINTPYRTDDDARTRISAKVAAPAGRMLTNVTVVLDENPMPVSAIFNFDKPVTDFFFDLTMRINGPTPIHVISRTADGLLLMADGYVKTSGTGACAAPPGTDPQMALATLGDMDIKIARHNNTATLLDRITSLTSDKKQVDVSISHPSHSGMQRDQISLLFIPMRHVENIDIDLNGQGFVNVTGSISLSENPELSIAVPAQTHTVDVI
ncbi:MAG: quinoprotein dehydrogenase-associated SoxYZ-like carrier, partial [Hyphomicrobiales bacterium]|nr:quinoprotein dehydrogenase-associated SoxYZ-like carrier [Hyphomicrobiales bacterium]